MGFLRRRLQRARSDDRGTSGVEYALVIAVLVLGSVASFESMEDGLEDSYESTAADIGQPDLRAFDVPPTSLGTPNSTPNGSTAPSTNVALHKPTTASSIWSTGSTSPSVITDGTTSGDWAHGSTYATASEHRAWVEIDLEAALTLNEVHLWNREFCCTDRSQDVEVWVDGVHIATAPGELGYPSTVDLGGITGQTIRFVNGHTGSQLFQLAEAEVMGY